MKLESAKVERRLMKMTVLDIILRYHLHGIIIITEADIVGVSVSLVSDDDVSPMSPDS